MHLDPSNKLLPLESANPGATVVLSTEFAGSYCYGLVLNGGAYATGKVVLPFGGKHPLVPIGSRTGVHVLVLEGYRSAIRLGPKLTASASNYENGQLAIDEDGTYLVLRHHDRIRERVFLVNMATWTVEEGGGMNDPALWPGEWAFVLESPGRDIAEPIFSFPATEQISADSD